MRYRTKKYVKETISRIAIEMKDKKSLMENLPEALGARSLGHLRGCPSFSSFALTFIDTVAAVTALLAPRRARGELSS